MVTCFLFLCIYVDKDLLASLCFKYSFELCPWQQGLLALKQNSIPFDCRCERGLFLGIHFKHSAIFGEHIFTVSSSCTYSTCTCLHCGGCAMFRNRGISVRLQYIHRSEREDLILILIV